MLQKRLDKLCKSKNLISDAQGSGKTGSRTSDHLMIVKFLTDKYVKQQGKNLYTCFVDLGKAFDTVPRIKLFYSLLHDYSIGGKFLKNLQEIHTGNEIFVKVSEGLLQPFTTTTGLKQGSVFTDDQIDAYIDLKFQEIYKFEHTPHPIEFEMYYSG